MKASLDCKFLEAALLTICSSCEAGGCGLINERKRRGSDSDSMNADPPKLMQARLNAVDELCCSNDIVTLR